MISEERAERDEAYAQAHIMVYHPIRGTLLIEPRPGAGVVGEFPDGNGKTIHIVTAHNPGRQLSDAENAARHQELVALLASRTDLTVWDAQGGDPTWQPAKSPSLSLASPMRAPVTSAEPSSRKRSLHGVHASSWSWTATATG